MAIRFGYETIGWHAPLENALREIKRLGFEGVEMFDLLDRVEHGENVRKMLDEAGLVLASAFFGASLVEEELLSTEFSDFDGTVRAIADLGGTLVVVGAGRIRDDTRPVDFGVLIENLNALGERARRAGIQMALHPHDGTLVCTREAIDSVMAATDGSLVKLALDTAHLQKAGIEPSHFLEAYRNCIVHVHLKDLRDDRFVELGAGTLRLRDFYHALLESGYGGWCIVELDSSADPPESAGISARYLNTLSDTIPGTPY